VTTEHLKKNRERDLDQEMRSGKTVGEGSEFTEKSDFAQEKARRGHLEREKP